MKKLIILYIIISSFLHSQDDRVIISINGLESAGLSKRHINFAQYSIREISIDLEDIVSKMIGDKYSINIHFTAYESVENTTNVARDSLNKIIKIIKDKYPDENLVTHHISHPYKGIQGVIIGKVQIQINIDHSINLDNISSDFFDWIFMDLQDCQECILFNSVDMASIKGKNTISLNRDDIYDDSWAVIIGIDKYKYSDQLNYAVKDAEAVKDMLIDKFDYPEENIRYLTDEEATLSGIKIALGEVATSSGENDRILVFYSGHGETFSNKDGTETGYIIPIDGKQDQPYETGLAMDEILRTCKMSDAKHMLFLMDACYSGLMTEKSKGLSQPQEKGYLSKVANEKARQIITAGGGGEMVIERDEWQHSAFTKNLLAGLDKWEADTDADGYITADELGTYLRKSVTEDSDFLQTPQKGRFMNSGGGEFVFFGNGGLSSNKDKSSLRNNDFSLRKMMEATHMHHSFISFNASSVQLYKNFVSEEALRRYSCLDVGWTHFANAKMGYHIAYNYCLDKNSNNPKDIQLRTDGITMELNYRVHRGTKFTLSPDNQLEQPGEYKFIHYSLGFTLVNAKYNSISSDFSSHGMGIIPEIGIGTPLFGGGSGILFLCKMGYPIFDMLDENNSKVLNGIIMSLEFHLDLTSF